MRKVTTVHYDPPIRTLNGWDMRIAETETKIEQEDCDMVNNNFVSREKQIEEMAKAMCKNYGGCNQCMFFPSCDVKSFAMRLYDAGCRKQSEVAREIFEEIENEVLIAIPINSYIDAPRTTQNKIWNAITELKNKYTEGKE